MLANSGKAHCDRHNSAVSGCRSRVRRNAERRCDTGHQGLAAAQLPVLRRSVRWLAGLCLVASSAERRRVVLSRSNDRLALTGDRLVPLISLDSSRDRAPGVGEHGGRMCGFAHRRRECTGFQRKWPDTAAGPGPDWLRPLQRRTNNRPLHGAVPVQGCAHRAVVCHGCAGPALNSVACRGRAGPVHHGVTGRGSARPARNRCQRSTANAGCAAGPTRDRDGLRYVERRADDRSVHGIVWSQKPLTVKGTYSAGAPIATGPLRG
jgi:hypothetical protein